MTAPALRPLAMRTLVALTLLVVACAGRELRPVTTPAPVALRCVLAARPRACPDRLPPEAEAVLMSAPEDLRAALASEGLEFVSDVMEEAPDALLPLMPPRLLATMKGAAAAHMCRARPAKAGAVTALAEAMRSEKQRRDFLEGLAGARLTDHVEEALGVATAPWLAGSNYYDTLTVMRRVASGLLPRLPPATLLRLPSEHALQYLFVLRSWHDLSATAAEASWRRAPAACRSAWATLAAREGHMPPTAAEWTAQDLATHGFLLEGSSPTKIGALTPSAASSPGVGELSLGRLRARALLAALPDSPAPSLNVSLLLQPALLGKLKAGGELQAVWNGAHAELASRAPFATARQIAELLVASEHTSETLPAAAGHFAWALPAERRRRLILHSASDLASLDSGRFTRAEARGLLRELPPETWLQARGLLRGVRASELAELRPGDLPQPLLLHLLRELPADVTTPAALALLQRVRPQLASSPFLDAALSSPAAGRLIALLSPEEMRHMSRSLATTLRSSATATAAARLPHRALSAALSVALEGKRPDEAAQSGQLLLGLRCTQLRAAGTARAPLLLDALNAELRAAGRPFPVHLRCCALDAMLAFLKLRAEAQGLLVKDGPLAALAPSDAEAFGAFVSASLPAESLRTAPAPGRSAALRAAGRLPLEELLAAAGTAQAARALALLAADTLAEGNGTSDEETTIDAGAALQLGSLLWLLPAEHVRRVEASALRAALEGLPEDAARMPCADAAAGDAWGQVALSAFGPTNDWSAGAVGVMADMLISLTDAELDAIPATAWRDAADVLADAFAFQRELRWPKGKTVLEACTSGLSEGEAQALEGRVRELARRVLAAARSQLASATPVAAPAASGRSAAPDRIHPVSVPDFQHKPEVIDVIEVEGKERRRRSRDAGDRLRSALSETASTTTSPSTLAPTTPAVASETREDAQIKIEDWCDGLRAAGPAAGAALTAEDIERAPAAALENCVEPLGQLRLAPDAVAAFWKRAAKGEIKAEWEDAGALLSGASAADVDALGLNLTLSRPEALDALWAWTRAAQPSVLAALAYNLAFANKEPSAPWTPEMLAAAGPLLCSLPEPYLYRIMSSEEALVDAAAALGAASLPLCPRPCLATLARLASKQKAFGPADKWTADDVHVLGVVVAGVNGVWKTLSADAAEGVTVEAIRCTTPPEFQWLTPQQAQALSPEAAMAISDAQATRVASAAARMELNRARRAAALSAAPATPEASPTAGNSGASVALDAALVGAAVAAVSMAALGVAAGRA